MHRVGVTTPCALASSQVVALVDGELAADEREWVESHVATCGPCAAERRSIEQLRELVARTLTSRPRRLPSFERVLQRIDSGEADSLSRAAQSSPKAQAGPPRAPRARASIPRTGRRLRTPASWAVGAGAGAGAALAVVLALAGSPPGRLQQWLQVPHLPTGTTTSPALTLTGPPGPRGSASSSAARPSEAPPGRKAARAPRATVASANTSDDLHVPDELRRRPGLFLDMGVVRRLDKLKKMEAIYRAHERAGGAG
jgi:hypothetical protein